MRNLVLVPAWLKAFDVHIEDAQTIHIALFGMAAHELLPDADAQNGLCEGGDDAVQSVFAQIVHRARCFALTGENHLVGAAKLFGRIRQDRFNAHALQGMDYGKDVTCIVFYDCNLHVYVPA